MEFRGWYGMSREIPQPNVTRADSDGFHVECPECRDWITVPLVEHKIETGGHHSDPDMKPYETHYTEAHGV
jgi:hypothetical protein